MVKVKIINKNISASTDEERCAEEIMDVFKAYFQNYPDVEGEIWIYHSLTLAGQDVRDIDIAVIGSLNGFKINKIIYDHNSGIYKDAVLHSFCYVVELKMHDHVESKNSHIYVEYKGQPKDVTHQSELQKYAFANYCERSFGYKPFVTNVIWLHGIDRDALAKLENGNPLNAVPSNFNFPDLVSIWGNQIDKSNPLALYKDAFQQNACSAINKSSFMNDIHGCLNVKREAKGLTRKKFEMLVNRTTHNVVAEDGKMKIFSGRAGTGKTVYLLQAALDLVKNNEARCLLLTFNLALVSDIRRLLHLIPDISDGVDCSTIKVMGLHRFFINLMKNLGINFDHNAEFNSEYETKLKELDDFVLQLLDDKDIKTLKDDNASVLDWDYVLIDEAQDWKKSEKDIIFHLYGAKRLVVADGVDQFVRGTEKMDFGKNIDSSLIRKNNLNKGLRQQYNLVNFVREFAKQNDLTWNVKPNSSLPGGKVIITNQITDTLFNSLQVDCKDHGGENYDILMLVPPTMVDNNGFKLLDAFKKFNVFLFDGTSKDRDEYSIDERECRVYQYDSCRGLEGWTTICLCFDELIQYKKDSYIDDPETSLKLTPEGRRNEFAYLWSLMPLSRPINTLVIHLKNKDSEVGLLLREISKKMSDVIKWDIK